MGGSNSIHASRVRYPMLHASLKFHSIHMELIRHPGQCLDALVTPCVRFGDSPKTITGSITKDIKEHQKQHDNHDGDTSNTFPLTLTGIGFPSSVLLHFRYNI